jgi:Carboxypeptidase regulatory-like domain/TonB-dependent Receptor Plug Domain
MLNRISATFSLVAILAITIFSAGNAYAQVSGATLSGTITDPSGAAIAGAKVSIVNKATGVTRDVTTDSAGLYSAPNLQPGVYDVTASASGFSAAKESDITLTIGGQQTLNMPLRVGEASQTIEVTAAAPLVQLGSSALSSDINTTTVTELPLNGRDWASLATLTPGVNAIETQLPFTSGALRGNRGFGSQLTISGGRPTQNNYQLDGNSINDYSGTGPGSVIGVQLGVDAIAEFSVLSGNYSAEYGKTSGGVINAISKSGTNAFHGDVYEFLRNTKLDANDYFSNSSGLPTAVFRRNQFGAAVGGPIRKDKTFFFFDYEGIRQTQDGVVPNTVPSAAARAGNLVSGPITVAPAIQKYLALYPLPNGPVNGDTGTFTFQNPQIVKENYYTTRVDHRISDKDSLFATYTYDKAPFNQDDAFGNISILTQTDRAIAALEESHIYGPSLVNTARLGFNRNSVINSQSIAGINPASTDPSLGAFPGGFNPQTKVHGLGSLAAGVGGGYSLFGWNSYQFHDDAFLTRGAHALKFGFAMEREQYNYFQDYNPFGIWTFNSLKQFLLNQPNQLEGGLPGSLSPRGLRQTIFGGYIQDDWHVRKNLTLNVGLRYEMATVINEVQGKLTNLATFSSPLPYCGTTAPNPVSILFGKPGCTPGAQSYYANPNHLNFEPRLGFAWDPRGDGKTAVRGGYAIFDILLLPGYFYTQESIETPFFLDGIVKSKPGAPLAGIGVLAGNPGSAFSTIGVNGLNGAYMEPNPARSYVQQWNINVQRQITPNLTATVGYIGSHGVHMLIRGDDGDDVLPTPVSAGGGFIWPANPTGKDLRVNPNFGGIRFLTWGTDASYEAVTFSVQKRMSHGFQLGGSYTYSRAMDSSSSGIAGDAFSNSLTSWFWFAPQISHGPSDFNVPQSVVINGIWQIPGPRSGVAHAVLGGWEMGSIFKANNGIPTTPIIAGDPLGIQNAGTDQFGLPSLVPGCNPVNSNFKSTPGLRYINTSCYTLPQATPAIAAQCVPFSGFPGTCQNLLGNAGRNSIVGPSLINLDFSLYKNIAVKKVSENFNVQFRAEFFNIMNHANFLPPEAFQNSNTAQLYNFSSAGTSVPGNAGTLTALSTLPRVIQFAVKVIF